MCSINGFNFKDEHLISKMNQITRHRGPDGEGFFVDEGVSLGHDRLSIIDLSEQAKQPMINERFVIIFNGEIYNFKDLRGDLEGTYSFKTNSDTEVILASYQKWGSDCVKMFNGIFAFAIWDKVKKELFLARDPLGVKPLYYFHDENRFIFSSEIKAVLEHNVPRVLNHEAFNHYLRVLYVPAPLTMFEGIYKFPPASFGVFNDGKLVIQEYWSVQDTEPFKGSKHEIAEALQKKVQRSVKDQLISDRPLGIYLSGGIDSTVVLDSVKNIRNNIDTFSVGFELSDSEEGEKFNADFSLARQTAAFYGTNHHEVLVSPRDVLDLLEEAVWHADEPISNPTAIAMMKLAGFAKQKVDVVLGGDGGDELFGGYERYRLSLLARYYQKMPTMVRGILNSKEKFRKLNTTPGIDQFALFMFQKDHILKRVINKDILDLHASKEFFKHNYFAPQLQGKKSEDMLMDVDRKSWLVDYALMLGDKMSMSHGLEQRVPLLDKELVEFAATIPLKCKVSPFNTKIILKEAFKGRIPDYLFKQPKRGWFSPGAKWLRHPEVYRMAETILSEDYCRETRYIFNWGEVKKILKDHREKREYNITIIWAMLTFQVWAKRFNVKI